ncbi:MAG: LamG-like jellyroll fold domain-containing protein, partial [Thermoguttaceae bacterium]
MSLRFGPRFRALSFESLEDRALLSVVPTLPANLKSYPTFEFHGIPDITGSSSPVGLSPNQVRGAYGLGTIGSGAIVFHDSQGNAIQGDGSGQTIAIVDAYDDPNAANDLNQFSAYYGLPQFNTGNGPTFQQLNQQGLTTLPSPASIGTWGVEESLDIEWAHVMAPMANIILFEATDNSNGNLYQAVQIAASTPGVVVVSMSFSADEYSGETGDDSIFTTPSGHLGGSATIGGPELSGGVTFLAAAGDYGAYASGSSSIVPQYPASSPNVVAVGGTSLYPSGNSYGSETAWGNGTSSGTEYGGGGGISSYEIQPSYQAGVVNSSYSTNNSAFSTNQRTYPDVSADGNPSTGAPIYDSYDYTTNPWASTQIGGTSLACPLWAGMIAVADQGRAILGFGSLDGPTQTLPALYNLPAADFNDILYDTAQGPSAGNTLPGPSTGPSPLYSPGPGYDLATGLGSPVAGSILPALAVGPPSILAIAQGPTSTLAGAMISPTITVDVEDASGHLVTSNNSDVTLSFGSNPSGGYLLGTCTVAAVNGVATFTGLTIDTAGNGYTLVASDGGLASATSAVFNITPDPAQPTVAAPASASFNPMGGKTASLSVLGADPTGEANLTYTWSAVSLPSGASSPTFSANQTNAAKNTMAAFSSAGTYVLLVTLTNASGLSKASSVSVTFNQTFTSLSVTPGPVTLSTQSQDQFTATELDQFGNAMGAPPSVTWSAASGTITPTGLYTPPATAGSDTITAQSGGVNASASVTIVAPVGWWRFNEGTGATADDSAATPDNGSITDCTWLQPPNGVNGMPALEFNGTSSVVSLSDPAKLSNFSTGEITLSAWIKPASISASQYIIDHRQSFNNDLFLMITASRTYEVGFDYDNVFHGALVAIPSQDLNSWVHLAGTFDGQTWRLYRNGQLVASSADSTSLINPPGNWGIGAATTLFIGVRHFSGEIDDVRIYSTAVSSGAISGLEATPPTVAAPAAASPSPVTGTTTVLSVLGGDDAGASTLTYTWATAGTPPAAVTFSPNGANAASNTTATFTQAGSYNFLVTITNVAGLTATSSVSVTVNQTLTSISTIGLPPAVTALDQFGNPLANPPAFDVSSDTITSSLALGSNISVLLAAGSRLTISGGISGAGQSLTVNGAGTVVLKGTNSYTGGTTVTAGTLILANSSAVATGTSLTIGAGAAFVFDSSLNATPSAVVAASIPAVADTADTAATSNTTSAATTSDTLPAVSNDTSAAAASDTSPATSNDMSAVASNTTSAATPISTIATSAATSGVPAKTDPAPACRKVTFDAKRLSQKFATEACRVRSSA